ncbi:PH domain-containing protein [Microbacteriaceae bacterium VKM Ac-2854]|nr:PH domain-containing protein [Microbacteriaceae bacterium VKM Ac-2854]
MSEQQTRRYTEPVPEPERLIARLRPRGTRIALPVTGGVFVVLLAFYLCAQFDSAFQRWLIVLGAAVIVLLACAPPLLAWASIRYRITNRRILARRGTTRIRRGELAFDSELEVTVTRTVGQRMARCGDVRILRDDAALFVLRDLPDPELVAQVLRDAIAVSPTPTWPSA